MSRAENIARLDILDDDNLDALVTVLEWAIITGDGWLQRDDRGRLRARDTTRVKIEERRP